MEQQLEKPSPNDGLTADDRQLLAQGHEPELERNFSALSALSLAFSITCSWAGYSASIVLPLLAGGGPAAFYCIVVSTVINLLITSGLAELASAFPSSGGQYHFAFMIATPKYRAIWAFFTGFFSVLAWALTSTSATIVTAQVLMAWVSFITELNFVATPWQIYLAYVGLIILMTMVPVFFPKALPRFEQFFFWSSISCCTVGFITLLAASKTKQNAYTVFVDYQNQTGWNNGFSFILGTAQAMFAFAGTDAVTHISEEIRNPGRHVPRIMVLTVVIGAVTAIPFTLALLFSATDLAAVSLAPVPLLENFYQATNSRGATIFWILWVTINYWGAAVGCLVTTGRLAWAFARDKGLPLSKTFGRVHSSQRVPVNATILSGAFCIMYGAIYVGSSTAFNSIVSMAIISLLITYAIPQFLVLLHGRDNVLPIRQFSLGRILGPMVNIFSCLIALFFAVVFSCPYFLPAEVSNMNYVSVVLVGIGLLGMGIWFGGRRKEFVGPVLDIAERRLSHADQPVPATAGEKTVAGNEKTAIENEIAV